MSDKQKNHCESLEENKTSDCLLITKTISSLSEQIFLTFLYMGYTPRFILSHKSWRAPDISPNAKFSKNEKNVLVNIN